MAQIQIFADLLLYICNLCLDSKRESIALNSRENKKIPKERSSFLQGRERNQIHSKLVETWKAKNSNCSSSEMTLVLIKGIQSVRQRSLATLSKVTVSAVVERTLHECKEKNPHLTPVNATTEYLNFDDLTNQNPPAKVEDLNYALEDFLIELLEIFGKITADILTKYLHQELMTVTNTSVLLVPELQSTQSSNLKPIRDRK